MANHFLAYKVLKVNENKMEPIVAYCCLFCATVAILVTSKGTKQASEF